MWYIRRIVEFGCDGFHVIAKGMPPMNRPVRNCLGYSYSIVVTLAVYAAMGLFGISYASDKLDIAAELSDPEVKLVVVDFYATWCKPCMKAMPEWKKLHKKYRNKGLRFIVVSADENVCSKPPDWSPDLSLCDTNGVLQNKFEIRDLPTSLLFSWEGKLAMRSHAVAPVEEAVRNYFKTQYKMTVDKVNVIGDKYAIGSNEEWVRDEVINRVRKRSKFDMVKGSAVSVPRTKSDFCKADFPPNSVLRIKLTGDETGERFLSLSLEKDGCVKASSQKPYKGEGFREDKKSLRRAVKLAVVEMLSQVIRVRTAETVSDGVTVKTYRNVFDDDGGAIKNPIVDRSGYLFVESKPSGATVLINGEEKGKTPYQVELMVGEYVVMCRKGALWIPARKRIEMTTDGAQIKMELGANYGILKVESLPTGAAISLNDEPTGQKTPYTFPMKKAGAYKVTLSKDMHLSKTIEIQLGEGKTTEISRRLEVNFGSIQVESAPPGASVIVDGRDSGVKTPGTVSPVATGLHDVILRLESHNDYKKKLSVKRGETTRLEANLTGLYGLLKVEAWIEKDGSKQPIRADVFIDGEKVGAAPFKKKLLVGTYKLELKSKEGEYKDTVTVEDGKENKVKAVMEVMESGVTWRDPQSGLVWQVEPTGNDMNWSDAKSHCSDLNYGGYSDWRLPSKDELESLLTKKRYDGCHWPSSMKGKCSLFWSSSSYAYGTSDAWYVGFYGGTVGKYYKTFTGYVRCVRGGP